MKKTVDAMGDACPIPVVKNKKGYRRAESTGRHSRNLCRQ